MPGPQLKQAIPFSKKIREQFPHIKIIWGGYFASNQYKTCLDSGFVDVIVNGPGDYAFPQLLNALESNQDISSIKNLIYKLDSQIIKTPKAELPNLDELPPLPYDTLNKLYPLDKYLCKTFLGKKTIAYHSSFWMPLYMLVLRSSTYLQRTLER